MDGPASAYAGLVYVRDSADAVHLADDAPVGGLVTGCYYDGRLTVVDPVPDDQLCAECRAVEYLR